MYFACLEKFIKNMRVSCVCRYIEWYPSNAKSSIFYASITMNVVL